MKRFRVAIVDDEIDILDNLKTLLEEEGLYETECFSEPSVAFESLKLNPPDVLITDISMPGMGGLELLGALRERVPDLPVIVVSGYLDLPNVTKALRLGATDVVEKPFREEKLLEILALAARVGQARRQVVDILRLTQTDDSNKVLSELQIAQKLLMTRVF